MHGHCEVYAVKALGAGRHRRGRVRRLRLRRTARHGGSDGMGPDDMRAGRMLAQGDLRLIALALIAEAPRHGYEIIKLVEEKTADWYSPSPGIVYPTLTYLEEAGYVTGRRRRQQKALHHHRRRPRLPRCQSADRRHRARPPQRGWRTHEPDGGVPPKTSVTAAAQCRRWSKRRFRICATWSASGWRATPKLRQASSKSWSRAAADLQRK